MGRLGDVGTPRDGALVGIGTRVGSVGPDTGFLVGCVRVGRAVEVDGFLVAVGSFEVGDFVGVPGVVGDFVGVPGEVGGCLLGGLFGILMLMVSMPIMDSKYGIRPSSSFLSRFFSTLSQRVSKYCLAVLSGLLLSLVISPFPSIRCR